ncbi:MAG: ABC transporter ATP-binding protein [Hyphomicrobiaceae bacterium]
MSAHPLLEVRGLVKRFGGLVATDRASLAIRAGEVHAVIGPNGAGKTTLIHQLSGALRPDAGRILLDGADITSLTMHERVRRGIVRSYQITSIFPRLPVLDNIALAIQARDGGGLGLWTTARAGRARYDEAAAVAGQVALASRLKDVAGALAHGEQRQLEVAIALATGARLMLLDEPMAGLGAEESVRMVELIETLGRERTILLVEHDMDSVFRLADTISTLVSGRVVATGTPDEIRAHPEVRRAYLGDEQEH